MPTQISVVGSGAEHVERAEEVGRLLAEQGATVVTGGLGEVMAAASRGANRAGGTTIGILPGETRAGANPWLDHVVATGIGHARNLAVVASGASTTAPPNTLLQVVPTLLPQAAIVPTTPSGALKTVAPSAHSVAASPFNNHVYVPLQANNAYPNCWLGCVAVFSSGP